MFTFLFFFNDTATTEIYTLSLHDALPIFFFRSSKVLFHSVLTSNILRYRLKRQLKRRAFELSSGSSFPWESTMPEDRKSTRLNSSHANISYAVFCLKKKKTTIN